MKKFLFALALTGCAAGQHVITKKCPTNIALVGDAALVTLPLYLSVDAYTTHDYPSMAFGLAMASIIVATSVLATENCK